MKVFFFCFFFLIASNTIVNMVDEEEENETEDVLCAPGEFDINQRISATEISIFRMYIFHFIFKYFIEMIL